MPISREYQKYLETELTKRKPTLFEWFSNTIGAKLPIDIPLEKDHEQKMWQYLEFVGWKSSPQNIYKGAIAIFLIGLMIGIVLLTLNAVIPPSEEELARIAKTIEKDSPRPPIDVIFPLIAIVGSALLGFYWTVYLKHSVTFTRIRATADLLMSVLYIVISLRIIPNFENALVFAAQNTGGTVGRDLKKIVWDLSLGKYENADQALEVFANKWKQENEEFSESIDVLRTSFFKGESERAKLYEEAINIILERNTDRMKRYTQQLSQPLAIINYMGITLPVLTIILFPILTLFLTDALPPYLLVVIYNVLLPIVVWWMINDTMERRPMSFGVREVSGHPDAHPMGTMKVGSKTYKLWPFSLMIAAGLISLGLLMIYTEPLTISLQKIAGGMAIFWGAAGAIIFYSFFSYRGNDKIRDKIVVTEEEFTEALFELGLILNSGYSVESSVDKLVKKIKNLSICELFVRILDAIRKFGYTFERAVFDPTIGVLKYYPSVMITNILRIFSEALKKGSKTTSQAMMSVSTYMKNVNKVEQFLREMIAETTAEMQLMMSLLVPVSMGIIIGLSALLTSVLVNVASFFKTIQGISSTLPIQGNSLIAVLGDITRVVPIEWLTVIVGSYMIEVLLSLSVLIATLKFGEDPIEKHKTIANGLFMGGLVFTIVGLVTFLAFEGIVRVGFA